MRKIRKNSNEWKALIKSSGWESNEIGHLNVPVIGDLTNANIQTLVEKDGVYIGYGTGRYTYKKLVVMDDATEQTVVTAVDEDELNRIQYGVKLSNMDENMFSLIDKLRFEPKVFDEPLIEIIDGIHNVDNNVINLILAIIVNDDPSILRIFDGYNEEERKAIINALRDDAKFQIIVENVRKTYDATITRKQFSMGYLNQFLTGESYTPTTENFDVLEVVAEMTNNGKESSKYVEYNDIIDTRTKSIIGVKTTYYFDGVATATWYSTEEYGNGNSLYKTLSEFYDSLVLSGKLEATNFVDDAPTTLADDLYTKKYSTSGRLQTLVIPVDGESFVSIIDTNTVGNNVVGESKLSTNGNIIFLDNDGVEFDSLDEMEEHIFTKDVVKEDEKSLDEIAREIATYTEWTGEDIVSIFIEALRNTSDEKIADYLIPSIENEIEVHLNDKTLNTKGVEVAKTLNYDVENIMHVFIEALIDANFSSEAKSLKMVYESYNMIDDENIGNDVETSPKGLFEVYGSWGNGMDGQKLQSIVDTRTVSAVGSKETFEDGTIIYFTTVDGENDKQFDTLEDFENYMDVVGNFDEYGREFSTSGNISVEPSGDINKNGFEHKLSITDETNGLIYTSEKYLGVCYVSTDGTRRYEEQTELNSFNSLDELESYLESKKQVEINEVSTGGKIYVAPYQVANHFQSRLIKETLTDNYVGFCNILADGTKKYVNKNNFEYDTLDELEEFVFGSVEDVVTQTIVDETETFETLTVSGESTNNNHAGGEFIRYNEIVDSSIDEVVGYKIRSYTVLGNIINTWYGVTKDTVYGDAVYTTLDGFYTYLMDYAKTSTLNFDENGREISTSGNFIVESYFDVKNEAPYILNITNYGNIVGECFVFADLSRSYKDNEGHTFDTLDEMELHLLTSGEVEDSSEYKEEIISENGIKYAVLFKESMISEPYKMVNNIIIVETNTIIGVLITETTRKFGTNKSYHLDGYATLPNDFADLVNIYESDGGDEEETLVDYRNDFVSNQTELNQKISEGFEMLLSLENDKRGSYVACMKNDYKEIFSDIVGRPYDSNNDIAFPITETLGGDTLFDVDDVVDDVVDVVGDVEFNIGDLVYNKELNNYGIILNNYGDSLNGSGGEVRLDSDGNQSIFTYDSAWKNNGYNLVHYVANSGMDVPNFTSMKNSANNLISSRIENNDMEAVEYYKTAYERLLGGEFDGEETAEVVTPTGKVIYNPNDTRVYIPTSEKVTVEDYPYGYSLRTTLYHSVEFAYKKGYRVVTQTINPKTNRLNAPKKSTYYDMIVRYYNEEGHIKARHFGTNGREEINTLSEFINTNFGLFSSEEIEAIYGKMLVGCKVDMQATATYGGSKVEYLTPLYRKTVDACVLGIKSKGVENLFNDIYLDEALIDATKLENYQPFKMSSH